EVVVGILQRRTVAGEDELVPAGREDGGDCGLADVAAEPQGSTVSGVGFGLDCGAAACLPDAVLREHFLEASEAAHPDEMEQLLPRVAEMLAKMVLERDAAELQLRVQDLLHQRCAAAAGASGSGARPDGAHGGAAAFDRRADRSLADVVAGADL